MFNATTGQWDNHTQSGCTMAVYGNGNIHLKQYQPDYVTAPSVSGPTAADTYQNCNYWASSMSPTGNQIRYVFDWGDGSPQTTTGYYASNQQVEASHSWSTAGIYNITVTAETASGTWSSPTYHTVYIQTPITHQLTVGAYDVYFGYNYPLHPDVFVDDVNYGPAPVSIQVTEGYHYVSLDTYTWDPYYWNCYATLYCMYNWYSGANYYNGQSIPIYSDTWIAAGYWP